MYDSNHSEYKNSGSKIQIDKNRVDWINIQIITEAYKFIFTKNNNFDYVKKVLSDHPELKNLKRNRIFI